MWNDINNILDIERLMKLFGYFHDSCLKEMKYTSGSYVDEERCMSPINSERIVRMIFQRQNVNPSTIELMFLQIYNCNLNPTNSSYTSEIDGATLLLKNAIIYWGDSTNIKDFDSYEGTWVSAKNLKWRIADEHIGKDEVYRIK